MARFPGNDIMAAGLAFAAVVAVASAPPPRAEAQVVTESAKVRVQDLDLRNPHDIDRLFARVGETALEMCGASPFSLAEVRTEVLRSQCWHDGVDEAIARIGDPELTAALGRQPGFAPGRSEVANPPSNMQNETASP